MLVDLHYRAVVIRRASRVVVALLVATASCTDVRSPAPSTSPIGMGTTGTEVDLHGEAPAFLRLAPVDRDEAMLAIKDGDGVSLTRVDREGARLWVQRLPDEVRTGWSQVFAIDGDRVIVWGRDIQVRALADGWSRKSISEVPGRLTARRDKLGALRPSARDGRLFVPLTDSIESTWISAFDANSGAELWHIKRPGQTNLEPLLGGYLRANVGKVTGPLQPQRIQRIEVLVAASGASVWSVTHSGVCEAEGWLVAATLDGSVAIWDSDRAASRPSISEVVWPEGKLAYCHRSGERLWLVVERIGWGATLTSTSAVTPTSTWTVLGPDDNGLRPRVRVSSTKFGNGGVLGKWMPLVSEPPALGAALLDIETGRLAWSQDLAVDAISYGGWFESDEVLLFSSRVDGTSYYMAIDRSSGVALGGAKISGAWLKGHGHGMLWFIAEEQTSDGPVGLAVIDARTMHPVANPGQGITVIDRGEVVRAAWRSAAPDAGAARGLEELTVTLSQPRGGP